MQYQTFANEIRRYHVETWYICNIGTLVRPNRFCSKICHVGGRILSVMLLSDRLRRSLDFDSLRGAPPLRTQEFGAIRKIRTGCDAVRLRSRMLYLKLYFWIQVFELYSCVIGGKLPRYTFLGRVAAGMPGSKYLVEIFNGRNSSV